jgi:PAS domain S-box-containing protein
MTTLPTERQPRPAGPPGGAIARDEHRPLEHALTALYELTHRLQRAVSEVEFYEAALDAIVRATGCPRASILLFDAQGVMRFVAWRGLSEEYRRAAEGHSPWSRNDENVEPIGVQDIEGAGFAEPLDAAVRREGIRALAFVPLVGSGKLLGKFMLYFDAPHSFTRNELDISLVIAVQIAFGVERRRVETTLRENEQRLLIALEAGRMGTWAWDIVANRVTWSPGLEALHGLAPGTFDGTFAAFKRDIHPDDWAEVERRIARTLQDGADHHIEYRIASASGEVKWVEGRGKLHCDEAGRPLRMVGVCADVTERKRAEAGRVARARQQKIVASLGELALRERDVQKVFEHATAAVANVLEVEYCKVLEVLPGGEEMLLRAGVGWKAGLVGRARVSTRTDSQAGYTLASGAPVIVHDLRSEERFRGPSLLIEHGVVSGLSCIIRGPQGEPWGVLGTHSQRRIEFTRDDASFLSSISNVLGHAIQRERAEAALREADRRKDEFIAMLSHELRNPIAPLRSALDLMRLKEPLGGDSELRAMMERQLAHLVRLVDDLLEASRISRGLLELRREPVQLAHVLRSAVEAAEPLVLEARHTLEIELPDDPIWVDGDAVRLAQCFANLLNNAARYTPQGGRIWLRAVLAADGMVRVSVRDTGVGFTAETKAVLFEMFSRGEGSVGLGIGLALARKLAQMHGGVVEAHSDGAGRGSEFIVSLPVSAPPQAEPLEVRDDKAPQGIRVVVADDNRDAADSLAALLSALGNRVAVAYDGVEAIEAVRAFRPRVVMLDIGMPRLDGYCAAREIRKHPDAQGIKLVALTGWGHDDDRRRAKEAGFDAHIVKPAKLDALSRVLADVALDPH